MEPVTVLSTTNLKDELLRRVADVSPRVSAWQVTCRTGEEVTPLVPGVEVLPTQSA